MPTELLKGLRSPLALAILYVVWSGKIGHHSGNRILQRSPESRSDFFHSLNFFHCFWKMIELRNHEKVFLFPHCSLSRTDLRSYMFCYLEWKAVLFPCWLCGQSYMSGMLQNDTGVQLYVCIYATAVLEAQSWLVKNWWKVFFNRSMDDRFWCKVYVSALL